MITNIVAIKFGLRLGSGIDTDAWNIEWMAGLDNATNSGKLLASFEGRLGAIYKFYINPEVNAEQRLAILSELSEYIYIRYKPIELETNLLRQS